MRFIYTWVGWINVGLLFLFDVLGTSNGLADNPIADKNGRLYDKAGKVRKIRHEQKEADGEGELT